MGIVKSIMQLSLVIILFGLNSQAYAEAMQNSPEGRWVTIDDETGKPKSIVEITKKSGVLSGKVIELLAEPEPDDKHFGFCDKCEGDRHMKPIVGMEILWGYELQGDKWAGGKILDPGNGKVYKSHLTVSKDNKQLDVRGYIGFSLIGRTQTWMRKLEQ